MKGGSILDWRIGLALGSKLVGAPMLAFFPGFG